MGKGLQHQDPSISPESPPGCMWILHRKRLPRKRKGGGKRVAGEEIKNREKKHKQNLPLLHYVYLDS